MRVALIVILSLMATQLAHAQSFPSIRASLEHWEGVRYTPYADPLRGDSVVGIGHNLTAHKEVIKRRYTSSEINTLYDADLRVALQTARQCVASFDSLPVEVQQVVVNLVWTCGSRGYVRFVLLNQALSKRDYPKAAGELGGSLWFSQVSPARATWAINVLRSAK